MSSDCCDGSDEHLGVCQNTCKEAGAAAREAARKALETTTAVYLLAILCLKNLGIAS